MKRRLATTALILLLTLCCCVRCHVASQQRIIVSSVTRSATGATDVTVASNGDVLFVSAAQHSVYRCASASGTVRLIAGSAQGFSGSTDETGTSARFFFPNGIVCDTISNVAYIADTNNDLIRTLVLSTGAVTTLAGSAGYYGQGYQDGTGTSAMFYLPNGIVLDPKRTTLYVTEYGYDSSQSTTKIRKIVVATAKVTTVVALSATYLNYLCISSSGLVLYVTAIYGSTPYVVQVSISTSTVVKLSSAFTNPQGIALNTNGTALLVADAGSNQTFLLDLSSKAVTTIAGTGSSGFADGLGWRSKFSVPYGSKWYCNASPAHCGVVVADKGNNAIRFVFVPEISISVSLTAQQSSSLSIYAHARHATSSVSSWSASQSIAKGTARTSSTSRTPSANRTSVMSLSRTRFLSDTMPVRLTSSRTESSSVTRRLTTPVPTHSFSFESSDTRTNCSAPLRLKLIISDMLSSNRSDFNASDYVNGSHAFPCSSNASALNDTGVSWDAGDAGSTMTLAMVASQILSTTFPTTLTLGILRYPSAWTVSCSTCTDVNITTVNSSNESGLDALSFLYLTSFVTAPPSSGTSLTFPFQFSCAAQRVAMNVALSWPTVSPPVIVSTTTAVTTTIASTVGATVGGDVTAAASLVLLSMLSCNSLAPNPGISAYMMSVFYYDGPVAMVTGNVGILVLFAMCHFGLVQMFSRVRGVTFFDASANLRFPAISVRAVDFLLPGTMFAAVSAFWYSKDGHVAAGVFGLIIVSVSLVVLEYYFAVRYVLRLCEFRHYDQQQLRTQTQSATTRLLFPKGNWFTLARRVRFWPFIGPYSLGQTWVRGATMLLALLLAAVSALASYDVGCAIGAWVVGVLYIVTAVVFSVVRPFRLPSDGVLVPLGMAVVGVACCMKASGLGSINAVSDDLTAATAVIQVLRTVLGVFVQWREGQWYQQQRHDDYQKGGGKTSLEELLPRSDDTATDAAPLRESCDSDVVLLDTSANRKNDFDEEFYAGGIDMSLL